MAGLKLDKFPIQSLSSKAIPYADLKDREVSRPNKGKKWSNKVKETFYLELSVMLSAGVDIKTALDIIADKQNNKGLQASVKQITLDVIGGLSLSEALKKLNSFTAYEFYSVQIGEETGRVNEVLVSLANHFNKRVKLQRQLVQTLSYPIMVLVTAFSAIAFMLRFIVPMFSEVFTRFGGELPALTKFIIRASNFFQAYLPLMIFFLAVMAGLISLNKKSKWLRKLSSNFLLSIPLLGDTVRCVYMARLCEALSLLISARVPLVQTVELVRKMINFYPVEVSLYQVEKDIISGISFYTSLSHFPIFDKRLLALVRVGEEGNKLDYFFLKLTSYYSDEVEHRSSVLGSILEPVIIILLGAVVGVVLLAMYLPLFQLSTNIQ